MSCKLVCHDIVATLFLLHVFVICRLIVLAGADHELTVAGTDFYDGLACVFNGDTQVPTTVDSVAQLRCTIRATGSGGMRLSKNLMLWESILIQARTPLFCNKKFGLKMGSNVQKLGLKWGFPRPKFC